MSTFAPRLARTALVPMAALALLAGCAPTFEARVARFSALPAEHQKTFVIEARNPDNVGGLEFATYANLVRQQMIANGFAEAPSPEAATVKVLLDYGVGAPREQIQTRPGVGWGGAGWGGPGWGGGAWGWNPYWGGGWGAGWGGGWGGWGGGWGAPEVYSVTRFPVTMALKIVRNADKANLFEGRAETTASNNNLTSLMPNLVRAMFTDFPGKSGQTVRVRFNPNRPDQPASVRVIG
jgi:hypothetical protein